MVRRRARPRRPVPVRTVMLGVSVDLLDQVVRHRRRQGRAAHQQGDRLGVPGQVHGGLPGGVGAADDVHVLALAGGRLGQRRAVVHPAAGQLGAAPAPRAAGTTRRSPGSRCARRSPSRRRTGRCAPAPLTSSPVTSRAVSISAPNLVACRRARSVSCAPDTPSGKPR